MAATAATGRAYEDFVPPHNMVTEPAMHTLSVDLTAAGYKKEHITVVVVRGHGLVVVRGERPIAGNRWSRFQQAFPVPDGCDVKGIQARFEGGVLRVTMPGLKDGGRLDGGAGAVRREEAVASPLRRGGYTFISERRKLATTVIGAMLVLFSLGIYVKYCFCP